MSLEPVERGADLANMPASPQGGATASRVDAPMWVADMGGTNARFGWVAHAGASVSHARTLAVAQFASPIVAAQHYLAGLRAQLGASFLPPQCAAVAVATAVLGDEVRWTNSPWAFSQANMQQSLGLERLCVLNDFEALASSLPHLRSDQLSWRGAAPAEHSSGQMLAVVGPGTGLGVAGLRHVEPLGWIALPGEGGHATLAAQGPMQVQVLAHLAKTYAHISAERLLCGAGLALLHEAMCAVNGATPEPHSAEQVLSQALSAPTGLHSETLEVFCQLLGSFAGNVALTLGARGGVYIGGGIVPRMGERFFTSGFRAQFEAKGRFSSYLADIPTPVITDTLAALTGAAAVAAALGPV